MKVLIATDSSRFARQVIDSVAKRTWSKDTEFRVITCITTHPDWNVEQELIRQCQIILDERIFAFKQQAPGHKVEGEVVEGNPSLAITSTAKEWKANLIVIGSHGDTGIRQAHIGSVASAVVNQAPCSVEVIKVHGLHADKNRVVEKNKIMVSRS